MSKIISTTASLLALAKAEGKVEPLNNQKHIASIKVMNEHLEDARREYKMKEMRSIEAASKAILTV
jgi:hypothetical protein